MEALLHQIEELAAAFDRDERTMPADVAVEAILQHREHAEVIHRCQAPKCASHVLVLPGNCDSVPVLNEPLDRNRASFECAVGTYFESKHCGRGTSVCCEAKRGLFRAAVSHGRPWQLQDVLVDGERDILTFQPLHEDLLQFNRLTGELKINAATPLQKEMYRAAFGRFYFGDPDMFPLATSGPPNAAAEHRSRAVRGHVPQLRRQP